MADDEAMLAGEIARLEAELQQAKLKSKKLHLNQELEAVGNVLDEDEFMVIQDLINDAGEEEYIEYTETSYEEYEEEEESYEEIEEYEEEEILEEEIVEQQAQPSPPVMPPPRRTTPSEPRQLPSADTLKTGQQNLRQTPWRKKQEEQAKAQQAVQAPPKPAPKVEETGTRAKKKVRPPPSKGGKPAPRIDPAEQPKQQRKNPLSRLIKRNADAAAQRAQAPAATTPVAKTPSDNKPIKKKVVVRKVVKKVPKKDNAVSGSDGPFKRRAIPNIQPSPEGQEGIFEQLLGQKLITNPKLHKCSTNGCMKDQELVCLYFAASWKTNCKRFNTLLKEFYYNTAQANNLEVVYVSADRSLMEFKDCFLTMPFLAMPAGTTTYKNHLTKTLKINEMPALVVLDDEGSVVTVEGVQKITELTKGDVKQANALVDRWKKTRPIPMADVEMDKTLLHGTMDRGTIYWS